MKKEKEVKICNICKLEIFDKEDWCQLDVYLQGKFTSTAYYHIQCFRDRFQINQNLHELIGGTKELIDNMKVRMT